MLAEFIILCVLGQFVMTLMVGPLIGKTICWATDEVEPESDDSDDIFFSWLLGFFWPITTLVAVGATLWHLITANSRGNPYKRYLKKVWGS